MMKTLESLLDKLDDSAVLLADSQKDLYDYEKQYEARNLIEDVIEDLQDLTFLDKLKILFNL